MPSTPQLLATHEALQAVRESLPSMTGRDRTRRQMLAEAQATLRELLAEALDR